MATESVTSEIEVGSTSKGSEHDLWINEDCVLTVGIDTKCRAFPPNLNQCGHLSDTIQGLARAAKGVIFHAENDTRQSTEFAMQPISNIADAIILLSQLSDAIRSEAGVVQP